MAPSMPPSAPELDPPEGAPRLLVVDDHTLLRRSLVRVLSVSAGAMVVACRSVRQVDSRLARGERFQQVRLRPAGEPPWTVLVPRDEEPTRGLEANLRREDAPG